MWRLLRRPGLLWRLPVLLGMAMIGLPSLLVYCNAFHRVIAGVPIYSDTALHGVQPPVVLPDFNRRNLFSGVFTHQYATYFGRDFPLLAAAVRAKGQLYWSVLHQSPAWYISIGRHDVLYENAYLDEYCSRDIAAFAPVAEAWAAKLMEMQRWYAGRGKIFLYLLTPSKASIEPENMPPGWPCSASLADRQGFHAAYRAILDRAGVNLVDAVETTMRAKATYPFPPFPPGGTHFNKVSTALAVQRLITVLARASGWRRIDDFTFSWKMAKPDEVDTDLLQALNVPYTGKTIDTPEVEIEHRTGRPCDPVLMAQVGGSFTYQVDKMLDRTECPPRTDLYEYFRNTMAFYPGDRRYKVDPARRAWQLTDAAQVIVLEENEELAARSQHGAALYAFLSRYIQADRSHTAAAPDGVHSRRHDLAITPEHGEKR